MFWSLSHQTYDNITVCSLGSLVICGVAGVAIFLGISQSWSLWSHVQASLSLNIILACYDILKIRTMKTSLCSMRTAGAG